MSTTTSPRRPYTPSDNDHLIFRWVKLDGESQSWVADQFGISQSTVSRIIQRYERWQAHAQEREGGRLDHTERIRYQRWLTSERNEQIIATCLRIAQKLEGFVDSSRSTTLHAQRHPSDETKIRTEHFTIDRTASVCRFLRLAHKIGMDQLKLTQLAPPPPPNPLSSEELAAEQREIATIQDDFAAAQRRAAEQRAEEEAERAQQQAEMKRLQELELAERRELAAKVGRSGHHPDAIGMVADRPESPVDDNFLSAQGPACQLATSGPSADLSPTCNVEPVTSNLPAALHNLHNSFTSQITATTDQTCTCAPPSSPKKKRKPSRITTNNTADWPTNRKPKRRPRRALPASTP